ncbi:hypothetical protein DL96DRAFT_1605400 [Flagelloscypha sp. PMI_526]|nr:hypothetical protein DL96DRAFT_1605400 [Flagelloscypha sp. PMI_526]
MNHPYSGVGALSYAYHDPDWEDDYGVTPLTPLDATKAGGVLAAYPGKSFMNTGSLDSLPVTSQDAPWVSPSKLRQGIDLQVRHPYASELGHGDLNDEEEESPPPVPSLTRPRSGEESEQSTTMTSWRSSSLQTEETRHPYQPPQTYSLQEVAAMQNGITPFVRTPKQEIALASTNAGGPSYDGYRHRRVLSDSTAGTSTRQIVAGGSQRRWKSQRAGRMPSLGSLKRVKKKGTLTFKRQPQPQVGTFGADGIVDRDRWNSPPTQPKPNPKGWKKVQRRVRRFLRWFLTG